jgi:CheY-like chemotaxis protein
MLLESSKTVLIIDDEPGFLVTLGSRLRVNRYEVLTAGLGVEGFDKAKNDHPDLILLDVLMPEMDGYEVLEKLKQDEKTRNIPVIMMTVKCHKDDMLRAVHLGAADYLVKPFDPETFLRKIICALMVRR